MSIAPFPHTYSVRLAGGELVAPPRTHVPTGAPPQFGGNDHVWSPEDLLLGATLSCLQTTFAAHARAAMLPIERFEGTATGTLVKAAGGPAFSSIELAVTLHVAPADQGRAGQLLRTAERTCIITRSLSIPVHVSLSFDEPVVLALASGAL